MARSHQQRESLEENTGRENADANQKKEMEMDRSHSKKSTGQCNQAGSFLEPARERERGRPKNNWRRSAEQEQRQAGLKWNDMELHAQDQEEWRIVDALCSTEELRG